MSAPVFPPPLATDCHTHLVGRPPKYPMVSPRSYTPGPASPHDLCAMMDRVGLARVVVVQISVFGQDNSCMIGGMRALGPCARGVVHVDETTSVAELDRWHSVGVRGVRANLNTLGVRDPSEARRQLDVAVKACERNGWHLQVFISPPVVSAIEQTLLDLPVPVVLDHFGLLPVLDRGGPAERIVMGMLSSGRGWVKISGTYRLVPPKATEAIANLARDLYMANPENIVWGSDWPHPPAHQSQPEADPAPQPYREIDTANLLGSVQSWFDGPQDWDRILVTNPARLYDFT